MNEISAFLGIDSEELTWEDLALCKNMDLNLFFDLYESDPEVARATDQHCLACPVMKQCGDFARKNKQEGVWGGVYWTPGGNVDRTRNKHKTDKVWKQIEERYERKVR